MSIMFTDYSERNSTDGRSRPSEVDATPVLSAVGVDDRVESEDRRPHRYVEVGPTFQFGSHEVFGALQRCVPRAGVDAIDGSARYVLALVPQDQGHRVRVGRAWCADVARQRGARAQGHLLLGICCADNKIN